MNYSLADVSVIIPTYNRSQDLRETLVSFKNKIKDLQEVIVVDQSTDHKTKDLIKSLRDKKIKYIFSDKPSLTVARNLGISQINRSCKIVIFLDDDVTLDTNYFKEILRVFNENALAYGVGGYYLPRGLKNSKISTFIRKFFFIEHRAPNSGRVLSSYGAIYPSRLNKTINVEWIPGFNMAFKKEVFKKDIFDEHLSRYSLGEDFDFTYRVNMRKPLSLFLTPRARLIHRASQIERYPARKITYMNQIHHFYLHYKNFNRNFKERSIFVWSLLGISLLRLSLLLFRPNKRNWLKATLYFSSLSYCIFNLKDIKRGRWTIPD